MSPRLPHLGRITVVVLAAGLLLTGVLTWAAAQAHASNEERLLEQQAEEATAVLQQAVPAVTGKAQEAARIAALLQDDPSALREELAVDVGERGRFVAITVDRVGDTTPLASVGEATGLPDGLRVEAARATSATPEQVHVTGVLQGDEPRLVYSASTTSHPEIVVHAEQRLPGTRTSNDNAAFDAINFALYLGTEERTEQLLTASTGDLPLDGTRTVRSIPLGDAEMRFVVSPAGTLGGTLLRWFPWLTAAVGVVSTAIGAVLVESLHRRRRDAEAFTHELHELYRREHAIAHTLQHSLLPTHLDRLEGIEVAARYFPGAEGTEIGGDWYDVIKQDGGFTVVVGDVVGRGVQAAAVMAAMRYGTHAVAGQHPDPGDVLGAVNGLEHIRGDFVTMLCGCVEPETGTVAFASAGHPPPLLIDGDGARYLEVTTGPPIGFLDAHEYVANRTTLAPGSVLVLFTDGLYERRGESIEVGLERLREAASRLSGPVQQILDDLARVMLGDGVHDDTAMLGFRVG
jgi:serine phosphatase RsbU (regulator of sigma subunit)